MIIEELRVLGLTRGSAHLVFEENAGTTVRSMRPRNTTRRMCCLIFKSYCRRDTRYTVDIGEFMSYVIHHMKVLDYDSYDINVHFGAMGVGIGSAIGSKLAEPERPVVCITGDGCFFMHGMEILTAKEQGLPILFIIMNNARLGMVYHGHSLQFKRTHPSFEQEPVNIAAMAAAMDIPSFRVNRMEDIQFRSY